MRLYTKRSFDAPFFHNLFEVSDGVNHYSMQSKCNHSIVSKTYKVSLIYIMRRKEGYL